ncbi:unnamed protein product, partial [Meganyctiphanes norvegica]
TNIDQDLTKSELLVPVIDKEPIIEVQQSLSHSVSVSAVRVESHSVVSKVSSHRGVKQLDLVIPFQNGNHSITTPDSLDILTNEKQSKPHGRNPFGMNPFGRAPDGLSPFGANPFGQNPGGSSKEAIILPGLLNSKANETEVTVDILNAKNISQKDKSSKNQVDNDTDIIKNNSSNLTSADNTILSPHPSPDEGEGYVVDEPIQSMFRLERKRSDGSIEGELGFVNHSNKTIFNALRYEAHENIDPELIAYGLALWENL